MVPKQIDDDRRINGNHRLNPIKSFSANLQLHQNFADYS
jgi:hypothetical protein